MTKLLLILLLFISLLCVNGCSAYSEGMSGAVVDAETSKPIEGAVVLVEWTKKHGIGGFYNTESVKVQEVLTDRDGRFSVSGFSDWSVESPDVTVYKKGYVCWNNKHIFPDYRQRSDFKWMSNYTVSLVKFKDKDSYNDHVTFTRGSVKTSVNLAAKKMIYHAFEWETDLARQERVNKGLGP